jgi:hypothetical protein
MRRRVREERVWVERTKWVEVARARVPNLQVREKRECSMLPTPVTLMERVIGLRKS